MVAREKQKEEMNGEGEEEKDVWEVGKVCYG